MKERIAAMVFALVCLVALVLWSERRPAAPPGAPGAAAPEAGGPALLSFRPASVRAIRLQDGALSLQVQRTADGWAHAARPSQLDQFLAELAALPAGKEIAGAGARSDQYGLAGAARRVELLRDDGPPIEIRIGEQNPARTGVYVQLGPRGRITLVGALLVWEFEKALAAVTGASVP